MTRNVHAQLLCSWHGPCVVTLQINSAALSSLKRLYKPDIDFCKAGVMLLDLQDASIQESELGLFDLDDIEKSKRLMKVFDAVTDQFSHGTMQLGSALLGARNWEMRQECRTPYYTTSLAEVTVAKT